MWPDNVKVFKGPNEEVSVLTCEGAPLSTPALSVHSDPCPAAQHSDRAAVTACGPWLTYIHPLSPNRQPSRCVRRSAETAQSCTRSHLLCPSS